MKKMTIDGNTAAAHIAYAFSEVAAIYPITPSSPMAEYADEWAAANRTNIFGQKLRLAEMQSEAGAAGAVHGSLIAGALTTTFTASQGLLLMIPNMYKIAGELLPTVFHVSARALAAHALNIFGDHADVMACRQTGFAMLASNSVQEVMDLALVSHLATLESKVPFLHFFDGFRTSHEVSKIDAIEYEEIKPLVNMDMVKDFRKRALNPEHPHQKGTAQNPDIYFQNRETANSYYNAVPAIVQKTMDKVTALTGRSYHLFDYVGSPDAERVIILMGSGADAAEETINYLMAKGEKVGMVKVRLYRPFDTKAFVKAIPSSAKIVSVLDRTKEAGSIGEPLYLDVVAALKEEGVNLEVLCGRYGLGSKEFNPSMIKSIFDNMKGEKKNHFTVGIVDDLTFTSLPITEKVDAAPAGAICCKFYGLGSDGTVGANKNSIKIIGDHTEKYAQAYFAYDSKKSGGITISHLRFGDKPIQSAYLIDSADFVACSNQSYVLRYDMLSDAKENSIFLLNCIWTPEELDEKLPKEMKQLIAKKNIKFYIINAVKIAADIGLGNRTNTVMQAAFFKLANVIEYSEAEGYMKAAIKKSYGKKGDAIVNMNCLAIDNAISGLVQVNYDKKAWENCTTGAAPIPLAQDSYFLNVIHPILSQKGDELPVSAFNADGSVPTATTQFEKRGVAISVPKWDPDKCIQCNKCSLVCPHATIRPVLKKSEELVNKPESFVTKAAVGFKGYEYRMQVSPYDCLGCKSCSNICPSKEKALTMVPLDQVIDAEGANWNYALSLEKTDATFKRDSVKGSQFVKPLFEFSGACAGCGETPYIKLITQLFGERMIVANATGCSSIYGGSAPTCPYTKNEKGEGPAWANSLFEDNAEFGFGMNLAYGQRRARVAELIEQLKNKCPDWKECVEACDNWIANRKNGEGSKIASAKLVEVISGCANCGCECDSLVAEILENKDCLVKKSIWIFGGDGWAYDIGFGGVDHVLAMGEDVNILVVDTEVYSNTGGQSSKSTPTGAIAKFAASGKQVKKKDLGMMAMSYGYAYVAQVAMGANDAQCVKAISEAEAYDGPSIIIAYAPCINHGIKMENSMIEMKKAVECGYWNLYRFNPELAAKGENPFQLDSKDPVANYRDFILNETRYSALKKIDAEGAELLFEINEKQAQDRLSSYKKLANK